MKTKKLTTLEISTEIAPGLTLISMIEEGVLRITSLKGDGGKRIEMEHLELMEAAIKEHLKEIK